MKILSGVSFKDFILARVESLASLVKYASLWCIRSTLYCWAISFVAFLMIHLLISLHIHMSPALAIICIVISITIGLIGFWFMIIGFIYAFAFLYAFVVNDYDLIIDEYFKGKKRG